jgi:parvulin-like peptidyl-prolyl isomerase
MVELNAGADFASLARKYSDDPLAATGGDLGLVQKSKMAREFAVAIEGLSPGQTTQPFRTENGIHLLKIEEIRGLREVLTEERLEEAYSDWLRSLRERALIEIRL